MDVNYLCIHTYVFMHTYIINTCIQIGLHFLWHYVYQNVNVRMYVYMCMCVYANREDKRDEDAWEIF